MEFHLLLAMNSNAPPENCRRGLDAQGSDPTGPAHIDFEQALLRQLGAPDGRDFVEILLSPGEVRFSSSP